MSATARCSRGCAGSTGSPVTSRSWASSPGVSEPPPVIVTRSRRVGVGLRSVVVERSADLLDEIAERPRHCPGRACGEILGRARTLALQRLGLVGGEREVACDRVGEQATAATENADEAREAALVHHDHRDATTDADDRFRAVALFGDALADRADERERNEVHRGNGEARRADRLDDPAHCVLVCRCEQHSRHRLRGRAVGCRRAFGEGLELLEVEDGVVERDRDQLLRLEAEGAGEVVLGHRGQVDRPDQHPRAGDADPHVALAEAQLLEEPLDRGRDRGAIDDLALAHRVERERNLTEAGDPRRRSRLDLCDPDRIGPDIETDQAAGHCPPFPRALSATGTTRASRYATTSL